MNGAGLVDGLVPKSVLTFRVIVAAEEDLAASGFLFDNCCKIFLIFHTSATPFLDQND